MSARRISDAWKLEKGRKPPVLRDATLARRLLARAPARLIAAATLAGALVLCAPASAAARPHVSFVRCPGTCKSSAQLSIGQKVVVWGSGFSHGTRVYFTLVRGGKKGPVPVQTRFLSANRLRVRVPGGAVTGALFVRTRSGVRSNAIYVRVRTPPRRLISATPAALSGTGMWIWYVSQSSGGVPSQIIQKAAAHNVTTVFIKSSDGSSWWPQFSPSLVAQLKASGLHVCAWQYVYGRNPSQEAALGARAVSYGADCLMIDAEQEYEGRYSQARTYISALRAAIGPTYPLALASFPYTDYHPSFPYSVFLGPGAAQFNAPQIYWKAIGTSVQTAVSHTYRVNAAYGVPIVPLGQAYDNTSAADILRFRSLVAQHGSTGLSWWDWQEATAAEWQAIGQPLTQPASVPRPTPPAVLRQGARGDLVVWAQEHLRGAGERLQVTGSFSRAMRDAVIRFQRAHGLAATGTIDAATWRALLRYRPTTFGAGLSTASAGGRSGPQSAWLPAVRYEIPPKQH